MQEVGLIALYVILGALGVAAAVAILWLGGVMAWTAFKDYFLSPTYEILRYMRGRKPGQ